MSIKDKNGIILKDNNDVKFRDTNKDPFNCNRSTGKVRLMNNVVAVDNTTGNYFSCTHYFYPNEDNIIIEIEVI